MQIAHQLVDGVEIVRVGRVFRGLYYCISFASRLKFVQFLSNKETFCTSSPFISTTTFILITFVLLVNNIIIYSFCIWTLNNASKSSNYYLLIKYNSSLIFNLSLANIVLNIFTLQYSYMPLSFNV